MAGELSYAAAFLAGVSGSLHCLTMCGGITGALGMRARSTGKTAAGAFAYATTYQIGRLLSYAMAGALCGGIGGFLINLIDSKDITLYLRAAAGMLLLLLGAQLLFSWRLLTPIEKMGAKIWRRLLPLTQHLPTSGFPQALLLGALWGWLPCGLVYSMLLLGVLGGNALHGALLMLAFGTGTLPAMLGSSLLSSQLQRILSLRGWRVVAGLLMMGFGILTVMMAFPHHAH
ncbi:MAG: sulfite exporter TauE/SafE family protein [Steroidobacteraceae bacterium]